MMKSTKGESGKGSFDSVVFDGLGRTDKSKTLSDDNQRGMYPLHFHETGMDTKHTVRNSVVKGSPGWGFVNHGSNVDFEDNVVYDATGAGFVTERGDERGTFNGNLAAGSRGVTDENDDPSLPFRRLYLDDPDRLAEADLGFHGHGFFITSPFVDVKDNAAVGNRDSGFLYYGLGLDHHSVEQRSSEKPGPLTTSVELTDDEKATAGFEAPPRFWDSEEKGAADRFPIMDLPFFGGWDDNYTAANNKGMQLRYGRSLNTTAIDRFAGRKKGKKGEDGKTVMDEGAQQLVWSNGKRGKSDLFDKRTSMSGLTAMNNKVGLHVGYSSLIDFDDIHIGRDERTPGVGRESKKDFKEKALTGIENANNNREHAFTNTVVDGYEIGLRTNNKDGLKGGHRNQDITWKNVSKNVLKLDDQQQRGIRK